MDVAEDVVFGLGFLALGAGLLLVHRAVSKLQQPPSSDAATAALNTLTAEVRTMSGKISELHDTITSLTAEVADLKQRNSGDADKLAEVTTQRDNAVAALTESTTNLQTAQAQIAALEGNTAAQEGLLQTEIDRIRGVTEDLKTIDAEPTPSTNPSSGGGDTGGSTGTGAGTGGGGGDTSAGTGGGGAPSGTEEQLPSS